MSARAAASVGAAALLAVSLAGCNFVTPQATLNFYDPSDGVGTTIGDLVVRNVLAVADGEGDVNLVFTAANRGGEELDLTIQAGTGSSAADIELTLERGSTVFGVEEQVLLEGVDPQPGSLLDVYFQFGDEPGKQLRVPVLDGTLPEYEDLEPSPVPTEEADPESTDGPAAPGDEATPSPTESPAPDEE